MAEIRVNVDLVKGNSSSLGGSSSVLSDCSNSIASLKYRMDPKILARRNIQGKISGVCSSLNKIEKDIQELKTFINHSMDQYSATERRLEGMGNMMFALKTHQVKNSEETKKDEEGFSLLGLLDNLGKYFVTAQAFVGTSLVLGKQIQFTRREGNKKRAVIHSAKWIKGKGTNPFFKKLARRMDRSIRNPGAIMKGVMKADAFIDTFGRFQALGISKAKGFEHYLKNVVVGVKEHTSGIRTSKIPGMIAKRVYPIDATLNTISEGVALTNEFKKGDLDGKDVAVSGSNIVIKTGAATAGAFAGGAVGSLLGPGGAVVGAYIGGTAGAWAGDWLAGISADAIRNGPKAAIKNAGEDIQSGVKKGFKWVKGIFK